MSIPVTIEAGFTSAVTAFNTAVGASDPEAQQVALLAAVTAYRGNQWAENFTANQVTVRSLADQLAAAQQVSAQLLATATEYNAGAATAAQSADEVAELAWQNTRAAGIAASVASQVASVAGSMPSD